MSKSDVNDPILQVKSLKVHFPIKEGLLQRQVGQVKAVDDVSFDIFRGETFGLVGESGCGKTTTGRSIVQLIRPTAGSIIFEGDNLTSQDTADIRRARRHFQMVFQDPYASLNPRMNVEAIIGEPLIVHNLARGKAVTKRVAELMDIVGLEPAFMYRYPHEFSGGQRQRIGIARALAANPSFIVCDEPISSLDVSIQAQIVNLLDDLQQEFGLTYLFIAHDLSMVRYISDRIAVMYLGQIMELATHQELYAEPLHPYTVSLLSAVPLPDPKKELTRKRIVLSNEMPSPANPPAGCPFHTRCPLVTEVCRTEKPAFTEVRPGHFSACHRVDEAGAGTGLPPFPMLDATLDQR